MHKLRSALPAILVAVVVLARLIPGPRTIDDSYITFRYAHNLLSGQGFSFNPGEAVLGTTTPLYTLLMAGLGALTGGSDAPFDRLALLVNLIADVVTALLLWRLGCRLGFERAGVAAALAWAVAPFSVTFAVGGLETSLYVCLLTGTAVAAVNAGLRERKLEFNDSGVRYRLAAALLASLALLTRPDALILLGPLALERLWAARRVPIRWGEAAAALLPYGAWLVYATLVFGSPLPHSILAKAAAYHLGAGEALIRLIQHYATPFVEQYVLGAPAAVGLGLALYPFVYGVGLRRALKSNFCPALWVWGLYPWLYLITFALPNPLIFRWYLTPPLATYFFFIFIGLDQVLFAIISLLRRIFRPKARPWSALRAEQRVGGWVAVLLCIPVVVSLAGWRITPDHGATSPAPDMAFIKLELLYRQAATLIYPQLTAQSVLAAGDVGVLGFFTPARILDTVGLNSPISTGYYPLPAEQYVINYAIPTALILDQQPDWIVILEVYARRTFLEDPAFAARYRLIEKIPTDLYGSDGLLIFQRKP